MPPQSRRKPAPVVVTRPGIDVLWPKLRELVLQLAEGDVSRIEVVSPTEAIVR